MELDILSWVGRYHNPEWNPKIWSLEQFILADISTVKEKVKDDKMASKKITRKWEVFAGRNKFWCDGRLMTAPHNGVFYLTVMLIAGTSALFFAFDCPFLAQRINPAIPVIGVILFVFTMSALLRTSFSDPGIIPRATVDEATYIEKQIEVPNSCNSPTLRPPPRTREILVKGRPIKLKYCFTCKMFRPPRASHCSLCDNCVDRFDHHCPWVGNCVGRRNYRYFYMFIVSLAFLAVYIFACAVTHIIMLTRQPNVGLLQALQQTPASVVVGCVCFFSVWSVLGLAGFHTYLTTTDQTTNEDIKGSFSSKRGQNNPNPFSRGNICFNCWHILCGPVAPSLIDRRGIVTNESNVDLTATEYAPPIVMPLNPERLVGIPPNAAQYRTVDMEMTLDGEPHRNNQLGGSYTNLFHTGPDEVTCQQPTSDHRLAGRDNGLPYQRQTIDYRINRHHPDSRVSSLVDGDNRHMDGVPINVDTGKPAYFNNGGLPNGEIIPGSNHVYSNLAGSSYMNHSLDLDPVVLSGSKENLVSARPMNSHMEMMNGSPNVRHRNGGELNHNKIIADMNKIPDASKMSSTAWSERQNRNSSQDYNKNNMTNGNILSASRLRLLHDTTMIDTALDLDSLDGSTISYGTATV